MKNNSSHPCMWQQGHKRCYRLVQSVALTALLGIGTVQAGQPFITTSLSMQVHSVAPEQQTGNISIKGHVVDNKGEVLIGVTVMVKGTNNGVITDMNGNFTITAKNGQTLVLSYIGYKDVEVKVQQSNLNITMQEDAQALDEVVVIGYGTAKKKDLTGAISNIRPTDLKAEMPRNMHDLLRANAAGLNISVNNEAKGGGDFLIRGKGTLKAGSQPLLVVDGVIYNGELSELNPNDIISIDVLKDASSAAVYGAKAANGVIAITTQKGIAGSKPVINVNTSWGLVTPIKSRKLRNAEQFLDFRQAYEIGQSAVNALRKYGVKTDFIARGGDRVGIYYLETGASMRPSKVIYDRAHSAIAEADAVDFDFDAIMEGADWFHWSGITPAISDKAAELTRLACEAAKRHGVTVSVDLNFRKKLWTKEKAQSIMKPLMQFVDVCIGNEEDAELCLGFKPDADVEAGHTDAEGYKGIFQQMMKEFGFKYVVSTLRESFSATHNGWKAMIYNGEEFYTSKRYDIDPIIDRVGGGDSFSGGIIHGLMTKPNQGEALEFAVAASALKHTINGDFNLVSVEEVEALAGGDASGRVQR